MGLPSGPMRLVINGRFLGRGASGVERYALGITREALARWPDARLVVPRGTLVPPALQHAEVQEVGRFTGPLWEQFELPRALRRGELLLSPANVGPLSVTDQVVVVHDLAVWNAPKGFHPLFVAWYRHLLPRLVDRCLGVIAVSNTMAAEMEAHFGKAPGSMRVVPPVPWVLPQAEAPVDLPAEPFLLALGAHDPRKGIEHLVNWYRSGIARPFGLVLVKGGGKVFRTTGGPEVTGVRVLERVTDAELLALYRAAVALVHPSGYEGFGLPVLEAMGVGCPVIARDLPVLRENFGDAFVPVDPGDPASWDRAWMRVRDPQERSRLQAAGKAAAANFGPERTRRALEVALRTWLH